MPKMKTKRAAAKRFSMTATGKIKRRKQGLRHILTKKTHKRKKNLGTTTYVDGSLNVKLDITSESDSSTATEMRFDKTVGYVYGTTNTPLTGAITTDTTDALLSVTSLAIHKDNSTGVAVPDTFKILAGEYDGSVNNFIYVQYIDGSTQLYTINQIQV